MAAEWTVAMRAETPAILPPMSYVDAEARVRIIMERAVVELAAAADSSGAIALQQLSQILPCVEVRNGDTLAVLGGCGLD